MDVIHFIYKHEDVPAFTMQQLIDYLNEQGKKGWFLVSNGKADKVGFASVIMMNTEGNA